MSTADWEEGGTTMTQTYTPAPELLNGAEDTAPETSVLPAEPVNAYEWLAQPRTPEWWARQRARNQAAIQLLRSWREVDEEGAREQRETWEFLKRALDEDRLSDRKLFPCE